MVNPMSSVHLRENISSRSNKTKQANKFVSIPFHPLPQTLPHPTPLCSAIKLTNDQSMKENYCVISYMSVTFSMFAFIYTVYTFCLIFQKPVQQVTRDNSVISRSVHACVTTGTALVPTRACVPWDGPVHSVKQRSVKLPAPTTVAAHPPARALVTSAGKDSRVKCRSHLDFNPGCCISIILLYHSPWKQTLKCRQTD